MIESRFLGKSFDETGQMLAMQRELVRNAACENLQGQIDLTSNIETIVKGTSKREEISLKNVRPVRQRETRKNHRDFVKEVANV